MHFKVQEEKHSSETAVKRIQRKGLWTWREQEGNSSSCETRLKGARRLKERERERKTRIRMQDKLQVKNRSADDKSEDIKTKDQGKDINKGREEGIQRDVSVAKIERGKIMILSLPLAQQMTPSSASVTWEEKTGRKGHLRKHFCFSIILRHGKGMKQDPVGNLTLSFYAF